jgi:hypothetical protein
MDMFPESFFRFHQSTKRTKRAQSEEQKTGEGAGGTGEKEKKTALHETIRAEGAGIS